MFFFKKKEKKEEKKETPVVNKEELIASAEEKIKELEQLSEDEQVQTLNEIGSLFTQAEETDQAILYYERSLEICKQHGKASTDLMKLYNKKRQEAAEAKDDEKVKEYMDKVQALMQMSKDMIRGNV
jgi:Tfp pilus assembly protein PilF